MMLPLMELLATIGGVLSLPATVYGGYVFAKVFRHQHTGAETAPAPKDQHPGAQTETLEDFLSGFIEDNSTDEGELVLPQDVADNAAVAEMVHALATALRSDHSDPGHENPTDEGPTDNDIAQDTTDDEIVFKFGDDIG